MLLSACFGLVRFADFHDLFVAGLEPEPEYSQPCPTRRRGDAERPAASIESAVELCDQRFPSRGNQLANQRMHDE